jgi:hypothetical protein
MYVHFVGNKNSGQGYILSNESIIVDKNLNNYLSKYLLSSFKISENYHFYHETELNLNEIYSYANKIFNNPNSLKEQSINITKHLYEKSNHPNIKGGEFYVGYFSQCIFENEIIDAIGIFKSEKKETYIKVFSDNNSYNIISEEGININKIDKGCLIFNTERESGYVVAIVDNSSNGSEAQYWVNDFLHLKQRDDDYLKTQNMLNLCKRFVVHELPKQTELSKTDQADLLNKSVNFFKNNDVFEIKTFQNEVISDPVIIDNFNYYKSEFEKESDTTINDSFSISNNAVKKQLRSFKSVIKLDKNFHIYVHGSNQFIQKGYDEKTGMNFYQLFFKEEL